MMIEFKSRTMPGLSVQTEGRRFKFAGGRLIVDGGEAQAIRDYAAAHPEYGITESDQVPGQLEAFAEPSMDLTKDELVALAVSRGLDHDAMKSMTKADIIEALGG